MKYLLKYYLNLNFCTQYVHVLSYGKFKNCIKKNTIHQIIYIMIKLNLKIPF
jgi:hypothetical protein